MKKIQKILASFVVLTLGLSLSPMGTSAAARPGFGGGELDIDRVTFSFPSVGDMGATVGGIAIDSSGSDLVVSNLYRDEGSEELVIQMTNQGEDDATDTSGTTSVWVDGALVWDFSWDTLPAEDQTFMAAGESSAVRPQETFGDSGEFTTAEHFVEVCVDFTDVISERDEGNNCAGATILSSVEAEISYPNLVMSDIYLEDGTDYLTVEMTNDGDEDVTDLTGHTYIWIDDMENPAWTYSWSRLSDDNRLFLNVGETSTIQPEVLFGEADDVTSATVMACVDYDGGGDGVAEESDETDNCLTVDLVERITYEYPDPVELVVTVGGEPQSEALPDLVVSNLYRDEGSEELVIQMTNQGEADATDTSGKTYIWIDGVLEWTYTWSTLSDENQEFMVAGQSSAIRPQLISGDDEEFTTAGHLVEACVDYDAGGGDGAVAELKEDNNCAEATILSEADAAVFYPDLKVTNVYLQSDTNYLTVEMTNEGDEDVSDLTGKTYIWVDDMVDAAWTYSWTYLSDENKAFLQTGETSTIQPQVLFGEASDVTDARVMACVDYDTDGGDGVAEESDEADNCLTVNIETLTLPQTYDIEAIDYGLILGATYNADSDARVAFEKSNWAEWLHDSGRTIRQRNRVSFDPDGVIYSDGNSKVAWLNDAWGWMDFSWCDLGADPAACVDVKPNVDLNLEGVLAGTGDAYWSGRAYVSATGDWINFGWTCARVVGDCSIEDRVHTDLETGEVSGYAWGSGLGWINFGNSEEEQYTVAQILPEEEDIIYVQPVVTLTPDPSDVTKYGQGGGDSAPLADGEESYMLSVKLIDVDTGDALTDDYEVGIEVTPTEESFVYIDQINRTEGSDSAVFFGEVTYDRHDETFDLPIYSWAPTSNVNGYDEDADGVIDFYFDHDPEDASGYARSGIANQYVLDLIDITVTGPSEVEFFELVPGRVAPLWGISGGERVLRFAPAIELTNLGRLTDEEGILYSIPNVPDEELELAGILAVWNGIAESFTLTATLNSDAYYYLFETSEDGNYIPGDDIALVNSTFAVDDMEIGTTTVQDFSDTGYYVPVDERDDLADLEQGSNGSLISMNMLVNENGYYAPVAAVLSVKSLFAKLLDWVNPFAKPVFVNAAGSGPDLLVSDISQSSAGQVVVTVENQGDQDVITSYPDPSIYINIIDVKTYSYSYSSLSDPSFLEVNGSSTIYTHLLEDGEVYEIEACVDSNEAITEIDETNNCYSTTIDTRTLPDLTVSNIFRNEGGVLGVVLRNVGETDVVPTTNDPRIYIYIDGVREWSYSYSTLADQSFLEGGGRSVISPQVLDEEDQYVVEACIDPSGMIAELDESNNCYETTIVSTTLYPDLIVSRIYRDDVTNELVVEQMNLGEGATTDLSGTTYVWIDGEAPEVHTWAGLADPSFMEVAGISEFRPETLTEGDHSVQVCVDYAGIVEETDENNNCSFATVGAGIDMNALYDTYISYVPTDEAFTVRYYSHYMPLTYADGMGYNVAAYDTKLETEISGSITSMTAADTLAEDSTVEVVGDEFDTQTLRNQLYQRLTEYTKGAQPGSSDVTISEDMSASNGAVLMNGDLIYTEQDVIIEDIDESYDEVTIATSGGNIFVDSNLMAEEATGLIAFKDSNGEGGNIYIHPDVTGIVANIYADGGLYSYDGDRENLTRPDYLGNANALTGWDANTRQEALNNQLGLRGSLISKNTLGGADDLSNLVMPNGEETNDVLLATDSSLSDLREFVLCWIQTNEDGTPYDSDADGNEGYVGDELDYGDMEECEDTERTELLDYTGVLEDDNHTPFYVEYQPPSSTLPVFVR